VVHGGFCAWVTLLACCSGLCTTKALVTTMGFANKQAALAYLGWCLEGAALMALMLAIAAGKQAVSCSCFFSGHCRARVVEEEDTSCRWKLTPSIIS